MPPRCRLSSAMVDAVVVRSPSSVDTDRLAPAAEATPDAVAVAEVLETTRSGRSDARVGHYKIREPAHRPNPYTHLAGPNRADTATARERASSRVRLERERNMTTVRYPETHWITFYLPLGMALKGRVPIQGHLAFRPAPAQTCAGGAGAAACTRRMACPAPFQVESRRKNTNAPYATKSMLWPWCICAGIPVPCRDFGLPLGRAEIPRASGRVLPITHNSRPRKHTPLPLK